MNKKILAVYISGGVFAVLIIALTIVLAIGMQNKPINILVTDLTEDMASELLIGYSGIKEENVSQYISKKDIKNAYLELLNAYDGVILTSEIDEETENWLKANNLEIEKTTIAKDALVFINNINNPIESLTTSQARGIYTGKHTKWIEIGGKDEDIIAYPPAKDSEEEYMMARFMGDMVVAKPKYRLKDATLTSLINMLTNYIDTREKSIFYTTFHNVKKLENDQIRIMSIDNVRASNETIKTDEYSATEKIYAIIRSDIPENSQTRRFVEYITSKNGQAIIEQCGYVNLVK